MKARLKTISFSAIVTVAAFFSVVYFSCNRDKCKTIVCAHYGVCNDGVCICPSGYEGSNCETVSREKFLGNWTVYEKGSTSVANQYPITISAAKPITDVVIKHFYNYFKADISAVVHGDTI